MDGSNDSKGSNKNQGINSSPNSSLRSVYTSQSNVTPRTFEGKKYYCAADVAKIIGVTKMAVIKWHYKGLFLADIKTHDGVYLYEVERVMQLKSVYHKNWMRGGYEPSPTTTAVAPEPTVNPAPISRDDIDGYDEPDIYDDSADRDELEPVKSNFPAPHLVIVKKPNVQIYPSKIRIEPNDKHTKTFFSLSDDKYMQLVEGKRTRQITEMSSHKKFGEILTPYQIINQAGYINHSPLDQFDRAVLSVCVSEYYAGNHYTTPAIIYRGLTGKVNKMTDAMPSKNQLAAILNSIIKLMSTIIDTDKTDVNSKLNYRGSSNPLGVKPSSILPCHAAEVTINGKDTYVICFDRQSPIMETAFERRQILTYDVTLLDIPGQNNSPMNITIKNYAMRRVLESIAHTQMHPVLTFDDLFETCRLENVDKKTKLRAREFLLSFFEHLQNKNVINSFFLNKKGTRFQSIFFSSDKQKKKNFNSFKPISE